MIGSGGMLGCSEANWMRIIEGLENHVTALAEWSCEKERKVIKSQGEHEKWHG